MAAKSKFCILSLTFKFYTCGPGFNAYQMYTKLNKLYAKWK